MTKYIRDLKVVENKQISEGYYILELSCGLPAVEIRPGQFLQLKVEGSSDTFLRRPFSVHDYDTETGIIKVLIQVAGPGSKKLSELKPGQSVNAVFPLGNGFTMPEAGEDVLLIGGGCGVAPLLYLGRELRRGGRIPSFLLGFRNRESILEVEEYSKLGTVLLTTEDGSVGEKGFVTHHSVLSEKRYSRLYVCGPEKMMKAVADFASARNIECEVSLENLMACGFGVCLCCIVPTERGNLCSCTDGPVFNVKELKW